MGRYGHSHGLERTESGKNPSFAILREPNWIPVLCLPLCWLLGVDQAGIAHRWISRSKLAFAKSCRQREGQVRCCSNENHQHDS